MLIYLTEAGRLVEVAPGMYFHREPFDGAVSALRGLFKRGPAWTMSDIRKELSMNRKFVVPLMEHLDRVGITIRVGDKRQLSGDGSIS